MLWDIRKKSVYGQVHKEGRDGIPVPEAKKRERKRDSDADAKVRQSVKRGRWPWINIRQKGLLHVELHAATVGSPHATDSIKISLGV